MTYYDYTAYVDNLPPDGLGLAMALESDRMANLALRDEQVVTERKVVAEERLGSIDDSVEGLLDEKMWGQAFGSHPYRFPVIGLMKDIKAVTPAKAVRFYRTFYAPNNAVVVIAGRFDPDAALALLGDHYGDLAPSTLPTDSTAPERGPGAEVRAELTRPVPADKLVLGFPAPALADADRAAYELLDQILAGGPSSRLYRRLVVERELASSVDGTIAATKHPGLYSLWVQMTRKHRAEQAEAIVDEELARLSEGRVTAAELARAKARLETGFWQGLTSSEGKAEQLGEFDVVAGDYRVLLRRADEYAAVTAEDVRRVARTYFAGRARSVVIARPGAPRGS
jgi:zinc protease